MQGTALRNMLELVSNRFRPYFGGALLIFLVTGTYLLLINKSYMGLGHFFGNPWSALIVIKHLLVLVFLVLAVYSERAFLPQIRDENHAALKKFRMALYINTCVGTAILLLTSIAQAV
jgi:putative copper export protein